MEQKTKLSWKLPRAEVSNADFLAMAFRFGERALRGFALGRKSWLFAGSERGADRAAVMATLIMTAKLNGVDPQAWLADVLHRINDHAASRLDELLPWNWVEHSIATRAAYGSLDRIGWPS
jgi:hypothetical protein